MEFIADRHSKQEFLTIYTILEAVYAKNNLFTSTPTSAVAPTCNL